MEGDSPLDGRRFAARLITAASVLLGLLALGLLRSPHASAREPSPPAVGGAPSAPSRMPGSLSPAGSAPSRAPYPASRLILRVRWNFSGAKPLRKAQGSDLWPCTWALDDALYCAWGDGGGFDGNSDSIGRVSLGFARVIGTPRLDDPASYRGKNVWGAPPYAEHRATFGGKVGSLIAIDGMLYANGGLWTRENAKDPVATGEDGPLQRLIWSSDLGHTWQIAPWAPRGDLGSYLQFGRDSANAPDGYVYDYFGRPHDPSHVYLRRIRTSDLARAPQRPPVSQYLAFLSRAGDAVSWSPRAIDAMPIFTDPAGAIGANVVYDAGVARYLMTVGHDLSGAVAAAKSVGAKIAAASIGDANVATASPGAIGFFEAPHPWGPWRTIYYSDDWGHFPASTRGDYLGLAFPSKWISADGRTLWGVFSGPDGLDAFNLVQARLVTRSHRVRPATGVSPRQGVFPQRRAPDILHCRSLFNAVNGSVFVRCPGGPG